EDQENHIGVEADAGKARNEAENKASENEKNRVGHVQSPGEQGQTRHRHEQAEDELYSRHLSSKSSRISACRITTKRAPVQPVRAQAREAATCALRAGLIAPCGSARPCVELLGHGSEWAATEKRLDRQVEILGCPKRELKARV